jgi:hypothetical protein
LLFLRARSTTQIAKEAHMNSAEPVAMNGTRKQLSVFAITERKDPSKKPFWIKVGAAFQNGDGSITLLMDAFPTGTNKLQVREARYDNRVRPASPEELS